MFGLAYNLVFLISLLVAVLVVVDIWANQKKMTQEHKIIWTVLAIIFQIFTGIVYYFLVYKK